MIDVDAIRMRAGELFTTSDGPDRDKIDAARRDIFLLLSEIMHQNNKLDIHRAWAAQVARAGMERLCKTA